MVLPAETKVFHGLCSARVGVRCSDKKPSLDGKWLVSDGSPNVVVVECPL
jgi:hypothetical protein